MEHNPIVEALVGVVGGFPLFMVLSTAVRTMPSPKPDERWYGWLYAFAQGVGANWDKVPKK